MSSEVDLYLDLLLKAINGQLQPTRVPSSSEAPGAGRRRRFSRSAPVAGPPRDPQQSSFDEGYGWSPEIEPPGFTMTGRKRLENVRTCVETVLRDNVPGDVIETGVWRGGSSMFAKGVLQAHGDTSRTVWLADSFRGLPPPDPGTPQDAGLDLHTINYLSVSEDSVRDNFRKFGLLDERVRLVPGWFKDTLPGLRDRKWSVIRLDGDLYDSTIVALNNLYAGLSPGGFLIVDDYRAYEACAAAVNDFRAANLITEQMYDVDWTAVCWRRQS